MADESAGTFTLYLPGDLNDDGAVDAADAGLLARLLAGDGPAVARPAAADVERLGRRRCGRSSIPARYAG